MRTTPVTDLADMRAAEEKALSTYGWVDKQQGVVHIPIEEAKKLLAARLAVQEQVQTPPPTPPLETTSTSTTTGGEQQ
jgi:hypothetical protein